MIVISSGSSLFFLKVENSSSIKYSKDMASLVHSLLHLDFEYGQGQCNKIITIKPSTVFQAVLFWNEMETKETYGSCS